MRYTRMLVVLVAVIATAGAAFGQVKKPSPASSQPASKPPLKLRLLDIGSVTPEGTSKRARPATKLANQKSAKLLESNDSGVSELRAVSEPVGGTLVLPPGSSKESKLESVHGEIDGTLPAGNTGFEQVNAAVGGTSKSGKTSVFIQTNHTTVQQPN